MRQSAAKEAMVSSLFATENDCGEDRLEATGGAVRLGGYRGMAWMVCVESLLGGAVTWCGAYFIIVGTCVPLLYQSPSRCSREAIISRNFHSRALESNIRSSEGPQRHFSLRLHTSRRYTYGDSRRPSTEIFQQKSSL